MNKNYNNRDRICKYLAISLLFPIYQSPVKSIKELCEIFEIVEILSASHFYQHEIKRKHKKYLEISCTGTKYIILSHQTNTRMVHKMVIQHKRDKLNCKLIDMKAPYLRNL